MLLSLPRELREQIYREVLCPPGGLHLQYDSELKRLCESGHDPDCKADPTILRTSKLIYAEALPILYSSNTLVLQAYPQPIHSFLTSLPTTNLLLLRSLTFHEPIPLVSFAHNFVQWRPLSAFLTTTTIALTLRTITIRPPVEGRLFCPSTFNPAPTHYHDPSDCWWPPARQFMSCLMDPDTALEELRLEYEAYCNPRTGAVAVFRSEEEMDVEGLLAVRMLRVVRGEKDEWEEDGWLEGLKRTGSVGIRVRGYNEEVLRRAEGKAKHGFMVTRREGGEKSGNRSIQLVLRRPSA